MGILSCAGERSTIDCVTWLDIVSKLYAETTVSANGQNEKLRSTPFVVATATSDRFREIAHRDLVRWKRVVKDTKTDRSP